MEKSLQIQKRVNQKLKPPKKLRLSEWADRERILSRESSSEPGQWRTSRAEYQREILNTITDNNYEEIIIVAATQMLKSEMLLNTIGYYSEHDPSPILLTQPNDTIAKDFSKERVATLYRDTPCLRKLLNQNTDTTQKKDFAGGFVAIVGVNAPANLAARPIRILLMDEVDRYTLSSGREGDPISIARKRTTTFYNRKLVFVSSPTETHRSKIWELYENSDKRVAKIPCPKCNFYQRLKWRNMKWEKDKNGIHKPETAKYKCSNCDYLIDEGEKHSIVSKVKWVKTRKSKIAGFWINEIYSPWKTWEAMVGEFLKAGNNPEMLKSFVNTSLAETFQEIGETPDYIHLYARRENYERSTINENILFMTASVDVQNDRLEVELRGWGRYEDWSIDYFVFMGDTAELETYNKLNELLNKTWQHPKGAMLSIKALCIDTGGKNTQAVYTWVRTQSADRVYAIKGQGISQEIGIPKAVDVNFQGKKITNGLRLWGIGVSIIKSGLYARLKIKKNKGKPTPRFLHFPDYPEEYFKMLTAESLTVRYVGGRKYIEWKKIRDRNEALDLAVYNEAAARIIGYHNLKDWEWEHLEEMVKIKPEQIQQKPPQKKRRRILSKGVQRD